jgi:DNA mismatch repair protein MutS2
MNIKLKDLLLIEKVKEQNKNQASINKEKSKINFTTNKKSQTIKYEINVIGLTVDEATSILDKYIDDAYISKLEKIRIVHGKGTGKLRNGIHEFLKRNTRVKEYRVGVYGEGEMGVTIVTLNI